MKVFYLVILGLISIMDTSAASDLYTHHTSEPESSYKIARTYYLPDYQAGLSQRAQLDTISGKDTDRSCATFSADSSCASPKTYDRIIRPTPNLTCYVNCRCPSSYQYTSANCNTDRFNLSGGSCTAGGVTKYVSCTAKACPSGQTINNDASQVCTASGSYSGNNACYSCRAKTCAEGAVCATGTKCIGSGASASCKDDNCASGTQKNKCDSVNYTETAGTATAAGTACYKCTAKPCPSPKSCDYGCSGYDTSRETMCGKVCNDCKSKPKNCEAPAGSGWVKTSNESADPSVPSVAVPLCTRSPSTEQQVKYFTDTHQDECENVYERCCYKPYTALDNSDTTVTTGWGEITYQSSIPDIKVSITPSYYTAAYSGEYKVDTYKFSSCEKSYQRSCKVYFSEYGWAKTVNSSTTTPTTTPTTSGTATTTPTVTTAVSSGYSTDGLIANSETVSDDCGGYYNRTCYLPEAGSGWKEASTTTEPTTPTGTASTATTTPTVSTGTSVVPTIITGTTTVPVNPTFAETAGPGTCYYGGEVITQSNNSCGKNLVRTCKNLNSAYGWINPKTQSGTATACTSANYRTLDDGCGTVWNCCRNGNSCSTPPSGYSSEFPAGCSGTINYWATSCGTYYSCSGGTTGCTTSLPDTSGGKYTMYQAWTQTYNSSCNRENKYFMVNGIDNSTGSGLTAYGIPIKANDKCYKEYYACLRLMQKGGIGGATYDVVSCQAAKSLGLTPVSGEYGTSSDFIACTYDSPSPNTIYYTSTYVPVKTTIY